MRFYCFKDITANKFLTPFPCENDEIAKKGCFSILKGKEKIEYYDKELYFVFEFDFDKGLITNNEPVKVDSCINIVNLFKDLI